MATWWPIIMLVLGGFFVGGVVSFARQKIVIMAVGCGIAAIMCFVAAYVWWGVR